MKIIYFAIGKRTRNTQTHTCMEQETIYYIVLYLAFYSSNENKKEKKRNFVIM